MSLRFPPPRRGEPITQWARGNLHALQADARNLADILFHRVTAASGRYHADRYEEVAALFRLHADLLEEQAGALRRISDA